MLDEDGNVQLTVNVDAPAGAFEPDTTMQVEWVQPEDIEQAVDKAVAKKTDGKVTDIQAVDITFYNAEGEEVEPATDITVKFASDLIADNDKPLIVHVDDKGKAKVVDTLTKKELKQRGEKAAEDELFFDAGEFSTYGIVVTSLKQTLEASDGNTYTVTVDATAAAGIPQGAELQVEEVTEPGDDYATYSDQASEALGVDELSFARFFDISIVKDGQKIQPVEPVEVKIEMADAHALTSNAKALHFGEDGVEVLDTNLADDAVSFEAKGFSVYAVVDEGNTGAKARMTLNFWNGETKIATMYVKNADKAAELETIIFDPGVGELKAGELFKGWIIDKPDYTTADAASAMNIDDIRSWAEARSITEGDVVNVYAMLFKTYSVTFKDEDGTTIHSEALIFKSGETPTYTINVPYTPKSQDKDFQGWNTGNAVVVVDGSTTAPFPNGTEVKISENTVFSVYTPTGFWLSFSENGQGASYTPPQFIKTGEKTTEPSDPTRFGYTFDGWYTGAPASVGGDPTEGKFTFGQTLNNRTTLYAKWKAATTANYTVLIWKQNTAGDGYDFAESITLSGNVGSTINTVTPQGNGDNRYARVNGVNKQYTGFHLNKYDTGITITPEGTSVVNVLYDRNNVTLNFYTFNATNYSRTDIRQYKQNGSWYRDNKDSIDADTTYYGLVDGGYHQLFKSNNWFYITNGDGSRSIYDGYVYTVDGSWSRVYSFSGLYGSTLEANKVTWPADYWWYSQGDATGGTKGTRITFLDAFLPSSGASSVNYYGRAYSGLVTIRFYKQDADGSDYSLVNTVTDSPGPFNISDKYNGFFAYSYSVDGGNTWIELPSEKDGGYYKQVSKDEISTNNSLDIRFNRLAYNILYMDGVYVNGDNTPVEGYGSRGQLKVVNDVVYGSNVSSYNKGGANYYAPTYDGFAFEGWYIDDACTQPYTFTTMPEGVTVYAKWRQTQYRVFLHPNADNDPSLQWGGQSMSFRVDYGDKIAGGNNILGTRDDYELIGWYADEACTQAFNFDAYVLNDDTVTTNYDKTEPTELDNYGAPMSNVNKDAQNDRFWITKKLDLYAKWRSKIVGAPGINVQYSAEDGKFADGTTMHTDPLTYYLDRAEATGQAASTPNDSSKQFMYWVVQKWDEAQGKYVDTEETVYPGDTFEVQKANARVEDAPDSGNPDITKIYTVQLRAEYGDKSAPTPTHIDWYPNYGDNYAVHQDKNLQINEATDIFNAQTRDGYRFLGWARIPTTRSNSHEVAGKDAPQADVLSLTKNDVYLTYHEDGGYFTALIDGVEKNVSQVAADEVTPYHDMYAVWEKVHKVKVVKTVDGAVEDGKEFTFTPGAALDGENFALSAGGEKEFTNIEDKAKITVTEASDPDYNLVGVSWKPTLSDTGVEATTISNGDEIVVEQDITITFVNKRNTISVGIGKTDLAGAGLTGSSFTLTKSNGSSWVNYPDQDGSRLSLGSTDVDLAPGQYKLVENSAPDGYLVTTSDTVFTVGANGTVSIDSCGTAPSTEPGGEAIQLAAVSKDATTGKYTVTIKNEPGKELPSTGGPGTWGLTLLGLALAVVGAGILVGRRGGALRTLGQRGGLR